MLTSKIKTATKAAEEAFSSSPPPACQYGSREDPDDVFARGQKGRCRVANVHREPYSVTQLSFPTEQKAWKSDLLWIRVTTKGCWQVESIHHHFCQEWLVQSCCFLPGSCLLGLCSAFLLGPGILFSQHSWMWFWKAASCLSEGFKMIQSKKSRGVWWEFMEPSLMP